MYTIGRLARKHGLSRSTLLYYDSIGLLKPSRRAKNEYRLYSREDSDRLDLIRQYRDAGVALKEIGRILDSQPGGLKSVLASRLDELNREIETLRRQQRILIGLLHNDRVLENRVGVMNRQIWVSLLSASGFSEDDMGRWHAEFERHAPEKHQRFLEFLCIPDVEIESIRKRAALATR